MRQSSFARIPSAALLIAAGMTAAAAQSPSMEVRAQAGVLGSGSPVVLLGGGLLGGDGWGGVTAVLARTHRVVNVQSLAVQYGLEDRPLPAGYSLMTEVAALRAALDGLAVERADVIGMSHGGVTALLFALGNPHRVRTLTLIEPPAFWVLPNHGRDDPGASQMQQFVGSLRGTTITDVHVERFRCLLGDCAGGRSPRQAPQWAQWVKYRNSLRALYTVGDYDDDPAKLRALSLPTLVIHGASTVPFHRAINDALLRALPDSRSFELEGGHNSPASSPEYFVDAWQSFQSQAPPPNAGDTSFDSVLAEVEAAQVRLVNGQPGPFKALWSQGDDVTLSGGLGGAIARGWTQVSERLDWVATQYADGVRTHQEVARYIGQDLAYVVLRETIRFKNPADGRAVTQELRVTQVFRREEGRWRIVHRHADSQVVRSGDAANAGTLRPLGTAQDQLAGGRHRGHPSVGQQQLLSALSVRTFCRESPGLPRPRADRTG
jgi:pimeloyl-ACP methyl ester carboxylesterase/ketosteroid isomerase-like protein